MLLLPVQSRAELRVCGTVCCILRLPLPRAPMLRAAASADDTERWPQECSYEAIDVVLLVVAVNDGAVHCSPSRSLSDDAEQHGAD